MSSKSGQSSELRDVLARIQNAKANKGNAERRLKRANESVEKAKSDVSAADAELKDANGLLLGALRKGMSGAMKDPDLAMAIAETIANAMDGGQQESSGGAQQTGQLPLGGAPAAPGAPEAESGEEAEEAGEEQEPKEAPVRADAQQPRQERPDIEGLAEHLPPSSNAA